MHKKICKECGKSFYSIKKNRTFCDEECYHNSTKNKLQKYVLTCKKCKKDYVLYLTEINFKKNKYKQCCSLQCSNSRIMTDEIKKKISETNTGKIYLSRRKEKIKKEKTKKNITRICKTCCNEFESKRKKLCCSIECSNKERLLGASKGGKNAKQNKRSKNEIYLSELCNKNFNNVLLNENIFNGWDADIILNDYKVAILWNGNWHYKKLTKKHSLKQTQNRDRIKIKEIKKCGYEPYIIKDEGKYNKKFVEMQYTILFEYLKNRDVSPHPDKVLKV
jgi:hypothetical protein